MERFELTFFYGPEEDYIVKEQVIADMAAAGFTLVPIDVSSPEAAKTALRLLAKHGIRATVRDRRLAHLICEDDPNAEALLREIVEDYREFDNVSGWLLMDEPQAHHFPRLANLVEILRRIDPDREADINLFPNYCQPEALECRDYDEYLDRFIAEVKPCHLGYDHYHFIGRFSGESMMDVPEGIDERERNIILAAKLTEDRPSFFANLETVRRKGLEHDLPFMVIVLLTEHGEYRNLCEAEIRWEVYQCLAYGAKRLSYFTYWTPEWEEVWRFTNACANRDGSLTKHYEDVCRINPGLLRLGTELFSKTSTAVFHLHEQEEGTTPFAPHGALLGLHGDTDATIGFFDDGSFLVVNKNYKLAGSWDVEAAQPLEYFSEEDGGWYPLGDRLTLAAGCGLLLRPMA